MVVPFVVVAFEGGIGVEAFAGFVSGAVSADAAAYAVVAGVFCLAVEEAAHGVAGVADQVGLSRVLGEEYIVSD